MLSDAQFGHLAANRIPATAEDDGGFTINTKTGREPTHGFAVSLAGSERANPTYSQTGATLKGYAQRHMESLNVKGTYMGAWTPRKGTWGHGDTFLDNSRVHTNRAKATNEMVMENQAGMYHLDKRNDPGSATIDNVYRQEPKTFKEPAGFDRPQFERDVADLYRRHAGRPTLAEDEAVRGGR